MSEALFFIALAVVGIPFTIFGIYILWLAWSWTISVVFGNQWENR